MALSPNYGFPEPDNSSLVKNGAQDIRALGDAIDTAVWNVGFGQAGKNKIINGDFGIWQRGTSFTETNFNAGANYTADRFNLLWDFVPTSITVSQQTFTPGAAPVAGYEGSFFYRSLITTVGSCTTLGTQQFIENVRTFAGQTATISFYAKSDSARNVTIELTQFFGSGGSGNVVATSTVQAITTSWARYTLTVAVPSISGKTIGTNSYLRLRILQAVAAGSTLDLWGVQVEYGSKATPFQTASGGNPQAELAMCQRYYQAMTPTSTFQDLIAGSSADSTAFCRYPYKFPVQMRVAPTLGTTGTASDYANLTATGAQTASSVPSLDGSRPDGCRIDLSSGGITIGQGTTFRNRTNYPSTFLTFSAEL
jgi:hypothetical protein